MGGGMGGMVPGGGMGPDFRRLSIFSTCSALGKPDSSTRSTATKTASKPACGTLASTWALFRCKGLTVRCVMWCSTACWVTHNLWLGSIGGTLIEGSFLIVNGLNIIRFRRMQKRGIDPFRVENAVQEESPSAR